MFERRSEIVVYTREQTLRWLTWLARSLIHNNLSVFYVERIQPDWLPSRVQRWIIAIVPMIVAGLVGEMALGLVFGLVFGLVGGLVEGLLFGLFVGLLVGPVFGLVAGLHRGGLAYIKHYVLRFVLWRNDYAPWNYIRFLDYAAERVFLRKVGGGYIFTHRLLMEYFATLQPTDHARQTKTA